VVTAEQLLAFAGFSVVLAATPGPSNALLTATGARVGVFRGLPALFGVAVGMGLLMFIVAFGVGSIVLATPVILTVVKWLGAIVLCWLAWKIASARSTGVEPAGRPIGFFGAAAFQWINPKSWLAVTSGAATFLDQSRGSALLQAATLACVFALITLPCCIVWLAFGAVVQRALHSERAMRAFNLVMGALLFGSVVLFIT
jgi:threonine/homoserine/homoserine lactone efflux protein